MVAAMFLGMAVLGVPAVAALSVVGVSSSELENDAPALLLFGMAGTMTAPMVGWMRYRQHGWRACAEMVAAMFIPTFGVIALLWSGLVDDVDTLLVVEHLVVLPSMLVAMLLRRDEYTGAVHYHGRRRTAA
jgi:hypothetical protein